MVGFAYTAASATADPGGFGLGNLSGSGTSPVSVPTLGDLDVALPDQPSAPTAVAGDTENANANGDKKVVAIAKPALPIAVTPLDGATRLTLMLLCAIAWALLTHLGLTRLRRTP